MLKIPELLAPAGDLSKLKTAFRYGADAVYIGAQSFSLRTACNNFCIEDMRRGLDYAKSHSKRVYLAANIIPHNSDLDGLLQLAQNAAAEGLDGIILSDIGIASLIRAEVPQLPIHVSTQASVVNYAAANAWYKLGATRVILAREVSRDELFELRRNTPPELELEIFVHGAMCVSYSGRCLLSNYMTNRDANKGNCAQSCRWNYYLMEEKRPGEYYKVEENDKGSFFFNSKDLCLIEHIPELVQSGVSSLKIEGRVKSEYYVATIVKVYRNELDRYADNPSAYAINPESLDELRKVSHRPYSKGFWLAPHEPPEQVYNYNSYIREYDVVGIIDKQVDGMLYFEQRNKFSVGDEVEILQPNKPHITLTVTAMHDDSGNAIQSCPHAAMKVAIPCQHEVEPYSMIRKICTNPQRVLAE